MASPLVGAWELESDTHQGFWVSTESHYCHTFMQKGRKPFINEAEPTEAEQAEAYRTLIAGSGTYTVSGSTFTINEETNRNPSGIGRGAIADFAIDGDKLIITRHRDAAVFTLRKVG